MRRTNHEDVRTSCVEPASGNPGGIQAGHTAESEVNPEDTFLLLIKTIGDPIMEMRHGMPVWAPSDLEMAAIANRVAKERAKAAVEALQSAKQLFRNEHEAKDSTKASC